ncbi:hypothetical protein [Chondromyces crocatus]|uniref:Secreted protein n=1 Tax=Chondromyces crocatus TaxID=52 RepID=A0A0K1EP87_CHOCO|nr:hypothetical protein [Chondromyces crocatus]AKT42661.1 uncharacterized protein CMC5_068880 [Chondromyces crocatus]
MAKYSGLALSSFVAGALLTFAASTAQAAPGDPPLHLTYMYDLTAALDGVDSANTWINNSDPCAITWAENNATANAATKGACFYTLALRKADPTLTTSRLNQWFASGSPDSPTYYDHIVAQHRFHNIVDVDHIFSGDVLVAKYTTQQNVTTGYLMVVSDIEFRESLADGTERYLVEVIDSTRDPHGKYDTRWRTGVPHAQGVGRGLIFLDADPSTGAIIGHSWSDQGLANSDYYTLAQRPIVAGRFDRNQVP